jgi:biotin carboxyl carrier protein
MPRRLLSVRVGGVSCEALNPGRRRRSTTSPGGSDPALVAPMPGKSCACRTPGESVRARQTVVVIEAMKMENELDQGATARSTSSTRERVLVEAGELLVVIR